jgi:hypothetical protein
MNGAMSAIGTKRTSLVALHMSAFGGKADILDRKADIELAPITVFIGGNREVRAFESRETAAERALKGPVLADRTSS